MTLITVLAVLALIAAISGRQTIGRVYVAISAQINKLGRTVRSYDPVAVLQKEIDDAASSINDTSGLEDYKGTIAGLERRIKDDSEEISVLDTRATRYVRNGREDEAQKCLQTKLEVQARLTRSKESLNGLQAKYEQGLKIRKAAHAKIESAKEKAKTLKVELKLSQAEAALSDLNVNFDDSKFDSIASEIQDQIDRNLAKSRVASDLGINGVAELEESESARSEQVQEELAKIREKVAATSVGV